PRAPSPPPVSSPELPCGGFPEPCANGGTCLRLPQGQGTCQCAPGFLGETCQFPDPCLDTQLCKNGGSCQALLPTPPSSPSPASPVAPAFSCTCPSGFTGEQCHIHLEDLCPPSFCSNGGHCYVQASGRPQCSCEPGWTGEQCQLRDFCSANPCANGGVCLATYPQIQCRCPPGFEGHTCEHDVNECFLEPGPCPKGTSCHNTLGSFQCLCPVGQEGPQCKLRKGPCTPGSCLNGGTCQRVPGDTAFHLCLCPPGFTGLNCEMNPDDCVRHQCQNGATCLDGLGTYTCLCPKTWKGWDCSIDIDECEAPGPPRCRNGGTCQNSAGGFHCVCVSGWGGPGCDENLDDCAAATCAPGSTCIDRVGSFSCLCPPGRTGAGRGCGGGAWRARKFPEDNGSPKQPARTSSSLAPAHQGPSPCEHGGSCVNTPGSFTCLCPPGYTGPRCEADHNECLSQPCHAGGTCLDLLASFHCICPPGLEGRLCEVETNECAANPCLNQAVCHDLLNGFLCICLPGFTGARCEEDMDECNSAPCANGGHCQDQPGAFHCTCLPGKLRFRPWGEGRLLQPLTPSYTTGFEGPRCDKEVDECLSDPCPTGASCLDLPGAFFCLCRPGFTGQLCDVPLCTPNLCQPGQQCQDQEDTAHCLCPDGSPGCVPAKDNCTCHHGHCQRSSCVCDAGWTGPECETELGGCISTPCAHGGTCHPQPSGYNCTCPTGYMGESRPIPHTLSVDCGRHRWEEDRGGRKRLDGVGVERTPPFQSSPVPSGLSCNEETLVNLCAQKPCPHTARCLQSGPSFQCLCLQGWTGPHCDLHVSCQKAATSQGVEVSDLCQNGGRCIDRGSSYFCHCAPGFQGRLCQDSENPCESKPCQHGATCVAQPNGYVCQCAPGYEGQNCSKEQDACRSQPCHNHGTCTPRPGGFHCACPPGFVGLRCEGDVDECLDRPCHPTGTAACHSLANAFYCQCLPGHTGQRCEVETDPCQSQPCSNGGSCEATTGPPPGFTCHCPKGFEGSTCGRKAPSCGIHHCHHGGLCLPSPKPGSPPLCACLGGFGGPDCLTPPAPQGCGPPSPCLHNGSCSETPRLGTPGFQCSCPPDSPGPRCQKPGANGCEGQSGDGACDAGCSGPRGDWDGGDCSLGVPDPWEGCPPHSQCWLLFRDGRCHPQCDSEECLFDGYDCEIPPTCTPAYDQYCQDHFHNGHCEKGCDSAECGWDGGDCRPEDGDSEWGPSLALLVVLSPPALDQQLLALARVLSLTLRVGLWVRKDSGGRNMVFPYPGTRAKEELSRTRDSSSWERQAPHSQPLGKESDSLDAGFVVVMGVDLSRCGPEHPASRCPWDSGLLLRFLAALAAVGALEPLLPGPLLAAHPQAGPSSQLPWPVLCSLVAGVLVLALGALLVLQLIRRRRRRREHGALWLPPGFIRKPRTQQGPHRRRPPLGEDSIGLQALKPEAQVEEDAVAMCSGPEDGEEAEETASASKCQLWPLNSGCGELPQVAAMLTPPQECEMEALDVDTCGPDGVTPLMSAVLCGRVESTIVQGPWLGNPEPCEPLLDRGVCPQAHTVGTGETPLHLAARFSRPTAARRLLEAGANPNQPDRAGRTPLHTAVAADAREVCQLLLASRRTAVNARTQDGTTPLMLAARLAVEDLVEELIAARADVGARDKRGKTALHWAAAVNNARAARSLLQAGADKDAQDSREQTPLFLAAREGAVEVAQLLLELGAARGLRDQAGLAPGDVARQRSHWDLLTLLEGAGPPLPEARAHARTASGGGAAPRCRTLSAGAGARPRGGGACLQARARSVELGARGPAACARGRSRCAGSAGPPSRGRRFPAGSRDDWPRDWVALEACGSARGAPIPPPSLTPSPEHGSPPVAWGLAVHPEVS
uniref:Neurogenic locus notch homolog protein 4 n=1 Tax=Cricetulus griseus TaxID=10029 RepID=A0A8C2LT12_CRIGR